MAANQYPKKRVKDSAKSDYRRGIGSCVVCKKSISKKEAYYVNPISRHMICYECANAVRDEW